MCCQARSCTVPTQAGTGSYFLSRRMCWTKVCARSALGFYNLKHGKYFGGKVSELQWMDGSKEKILRPLNHNITKEV